MQTQAHKHSYRRPHKSNFKTQGVRHPVERVCAWFKNTSYMLLAMMTYTALPVALYGIQCTTTQSSVKFGKLARENFSKFYHAASYYCVENLTIGKLW